MEPFVVPFRVLRQKKIMTGDCVVLIPLGGEKKSEPCAQNKILVPLGVFFFFKISNNHPCRFYVGAFLEVQGTTATKISG